MPNPGNPPATIARYAALYLAAVAEGHAPPGAPVGAYRRSARVVAGERMGMSIDSAKRLYRDALKAGLLGEKPRVRVKAGSSAAGVVETPAAAEPDPIERRRELMLINQLRAQLKKAETELIAQQDWRRKVEAMSSASVEPARWISRPALAKGHSLVPMLFSSDFQCGEVIRAEELEGINEYNQHIFVERYQAMIDKTIDLATHNTGATEFPYAVYLRGGDAISGEIHEELAQTNDLSSVPALRLLKQQEAEGIRRLKARFGKVRVISIPGNHGRTTFKSHAKGYAERSFETALAWWLADTFDGDPNVTFWAPPSGDALFNVSGWSFLLSHGDRTGSKGGQGFVGPAATISRGHQKLYNNWTMTGRDVHAVLTGHLHTSLKLERGYSNGSLAGYSEYARDFRAMPDSAKQWLFFVHQEVMISHAFELILSPKPKRTMFEQGAIAA